MPLKHWTPGCCCGEGTPTDCGIFFDDFDRADSDTIGNGWGESGNYIIAEFNLEGFSGDAWAPVVGGPTISISTVVRFTDATQIAKIYYGGPGYYVAITPTSTSTTTRHFWLVYNGAVVDRDTASFPLLQFNSVNICITSNSVTAFSGTKSLQHVPASMTVAGACGVGVQGNTGNGPVLFDYFSVGVVSDTCYDCAPVTCAACSWPSQWLVDLSAWSNNMESPIGFSGDSPPDVNCDECATWGQYILDPREGGDGAGRCIWEYEEPFCNGFFPLGLSGCTEVYLNITLQADYYDPLQNRDALPCGMGISIGLREFQGESGGCVGIQEIRQSVRYAGNAHDADTNGPGISVMHKQLGLTNGAFRLDNSFISFPACVKRVIVTGPGTVDYEYYFPPETITVTRL